MWKWLEKVIGTSEQPLILTKEVKPKLKTYKIKGRTYYLRKTKKKAKK
ncbi:MAG: hypothetical protein H8D84_01570 [Proteobacteria bacterium]|nr:hypothetical protein [Pseudomonadota bacterium]